MTHKLVDNTRADSLATRLRRARFLILMEMVEAFDRNPVKILDVGGSEGYWRMMTSPDVLKDRVEVTLLNIVKQPVSLEGFDSVIGDARDMMEFDDKSFDVVYSNSTIEHVGTLQDQIDMAKEVARVGKAYCIQTPNRFFPVEPHFLFPMFQFLPIRLRVWLAHHFSLGWYSKFESRESALAEVSSIRLLTRKELRRLFPGAEIIDEKFFGFAKSFVVRKGIDEVNQNDVGKPSEEVTVLEMDGGPNPDAR